MLHVNNSDDECCMWASDALIHYLVGEVWFVGQVDVSELQQKLQAMDSLQKELDGIRRQRADADEAAVNAAQRPSAGVWGWLSGHQQEQKSVEV